MLQISASKMRKAELSFSIVVSALIAILVFVVLAIVFRKQLVELLKPLSEIIKGVVGLASEVGNIK